VFKSKKQNCSPKFFTGTTTVQSRLHAKVSAIAVGSLLISTGNASFVFAAGASDASATAPTATAPTTNKQLAAIELQGGKAKDATSPAVPNPTAAQAPTATAPTTSAATATAGTANAPGTASTAQTPKTAIPYSSGLQPSAATAGGDDEAAAPKMLLKKGQPIEIGGFVEDIQPTDDIELAKEQALHFPDSAEASFVLAVALTRTSRVEEALAEVRRARRLAQAEGGPAYFDKMIKSYEDMLQNAEDPRVRYSLAWAYYMKAYLLAQDSRRAMGNPQLAAAQAAAAQAAAQTAAKPPGAAATQTVTPTSPATATTPATTTPAATTPAATTPAATTPAATTPAAAAPAAVTPAAVTSSPSPTTPANTAVPNLLSAKAEKKKVDPTMAIMLLQGLNPDIAKKMAQPESGKMPAAQLPMIPTAIQKAAPSAVPQVHQYYAEALKNLDAVLAKKPDDVWALLYRWHLYAEDTGNLGEAMKQWKEAEHRFPGNPGVQLFLAEGYVKEGNLKEAIMHASKAVFLRGTGN
jgi:tetratricopeptide (TPR) repeat protein